MRSLKRNSKDSSAQSTATSYFKTFQPNLHLPTEAEIQAEIRRELDQYSLDQNY